MASNTSKETISTDHLRHAIADGLLYTHSRLNANQRKTLEAASFLYALVELLNEKGLITIAELDERKAVVAQRLTEQVRREGNGALVQEPEYDKYDFPHGAQIDCAQRVHLCQASCCRLPFALSKQDVREGIVHWDFGQPYLIGHTAAGYCIHMAQDTCACTIYDQRPAPCRGYDCRHDQRIWLDFERMIPNPATAQPDWPALLVEQTESRGEVL
ncbi:MAG: YkgJ family cysteine cluster protein [Caldilineaceae bacterium]